MVILDKIERGHDCRTTVMIRNIPNKMHAGDLKEWLDDTSYGLYDFSYLRIDFSNNCNVGYAFVNFSKPEYIVDFCKRRVGTEYGYYESKKTCEVSYATIQGWDCLITKFRNSSVMREAHGFRPKIFFTYESTDIPSGLYPGDEAIFPEPDNQSKLRRSLDNASSVGLYPP
ncbi:RNA recognition motif 2-domain-containing protein, partial [Delphinella strobiligena]